MQDHPPTIQGTEPELENATVLFQGDYPKIFRYIMSMVRDTREAEDLTQETFVRLLNSATFASAEAADPFVFTVAANLLRDRDGVVRERRREDAVDRKPLVDQTDPTQLRGGACRLAKRRALRSSDEHDRRPLRVFERSTGVEKAIVPRGEAPVRAEAVQRVREIISLQREMTGKPVVVVPVVAVVPVVDVVVCTRNSSPRSLAPAKLAATARQVFGAQRIHVAFNVATALDKARALAAPLPGGTLDSALAWSAADTLFGTRARNLAVGAYAADLRRWDAHASAIRNAGKVRRQLEAAQDTSQVRIAAAYERALVAYGKARRGDVARHAAAAHDSQRGDAIAVR